MSRSTRSAALALLMLLAGVLHVGAQDAPREPDVAARSGPVTARELLGARRRDIDAARAATGEEEGWTRYGDTLAIRYEADVATRVRVWVGDVSCEDAGRAAGYAPRAGTAPLRRADGCEWPGLSARHRLASGVGARLSGGVLELWTIH